MTHAFTSVDELGDNYGFRKVRARLGVTAFGVNVIVYPPGAKGVLHYHDVQDELYFVHSGTARFEVDGEVRELGPGGCVTSSRRRRARSRTQATRTSCCWSSAARTATSSATASS